MPFVILSGGPGVGKTALLDELARRGHAVVRESAREVIADRLAAGLCARPEPPAFAAEILRRDLAKIRALPGLAAWTFLDRGPIDALGMAHAAGSLAPKALDALLAEFPFHRVVFVLPPWQAIYVRDAERDQSFADCLRVHEDVMQWYTACGFAIDEVPRVSARQRADYVLGALDRGADACDIARPSLPPV